MWRFFSEVFEGFFCHNLDYHPYTKIVTDMFDKIDLFKSQRKDLLQKLAKKIGISIYGGNIGKDVNEEYKFVRETWMRDNFKAWVKEWFPLKNCNDYDKAKSLKGIPSHFGSYFLSHSKRLVNDVMEQICGFCIISVYYTDTNSLYIHKK